MNKYKEYYEYHSPCVFQDINKHKEIIKNKTILDIGSNIGIFSKLVAENVPYKHLHLFEPSFEYCSISQVFLKDFKNITFNNIALGSSSDTSILYKCKEKNLGWNTMLTKDPHQPEDFYNKLEPETVIVKPLDLYYKDIDDIGFIKIDVEGYERHVLEGSLNLIEKFKPYILIEVGWGMNHPEWDSNYNTYKKLFDIGYKPIKFSPNTTYDILFEPI
jgi:FkbM family methyltransferase